MMFGRSRRGRAAAGGKREPDPTPGELVASAEAAGGRAPQSTPAPAPGRARISATSPLFRERAVSRYQQREGVAEVLQVGTPITWLVFLSATAAVCVGLAVAAFAHVEVVSRARGVMRPLDGVIAIAAQAEGLIAEVNAHAGEEVARGQTLLRVDSAQLRAAVLAAERQIEIASAELSYLENERLRLHGAAHKLLQQRAQLAERRMSSQQQYIDRVLGRLQVAAKLDERGIVAKREVDELRDELSAGERQVLGFEGELTAAQLERNQLERQHEALVRDWTSKRRGAEAQLESAKILLDRTDVRAPFDGTIESLLVRPGAQVSAATPVGRVIPRALSDRVVVFIPERDRAFVRAGAAARLSVDQLPAAEFGVLRASVVRVARAVATRDEIQDVLGSELTDSGPYFRVELALVDDAKRRKLSPYLRTGALLTAHIVLRTQRVAALLLRPLKELLGP